MKAIEKINSGGVFSSAVVKIIAFIIMTIDHIATYMPEAPIISENAAALRALGRIAAPLFLYIVVESIGHTHNKKQYLLRMLIASECVSVLNTIAGKLLNVDFGNILHSFVWVILVCLLIETAAKCFKKKNYKSAIIHIGTLVLAIAVTVAIDMLLLKTNTTMSMTIREFIRSPFSIDYGWTFIALGVAWYFLRTKLNRCVLFLALCLVMIFAPFNLPTTGFITGMQWTMIGALPIMLLYNGERGRFGKKLQYFFYVYYPSHIYLLAVLGFAIASR